jgi:hypothetical protein
VAWEIDTVQYIELNNVTHLGQLEELCRLAPKYLRDALDRGDLYGAVHMSTGAPNIRWLVADDPTTARQEVAEAMRKWPAHGFHVEHMSELLALTFADIYSGCADGAHRRIVDRWPALVRSQLLRIQLAFITMRQIRALAAITAADESPASRPQLLIGAERDARAMLRTRMAVGRVLAKPLLAGVHVVRGAQGYERAITLLREAAREGDDLSMRLWSTAARRSLGRLLGGDEGAELVRAADAWMTAQGVKKPEKMCAMLAPGFSRLK